MGKKFPFLWIKKKLGNTFFFFGRYGVTRYRRNGNRSGDDSISIKRSSQVRRADNCSEKKKLPSLPSWMIRFQWKRSRPKSHTTVTELLPSCYRVVFLVLYRVFFFVLFRPWRGSQFDGQWQVFTPDGSCGIKLFTWYFFLFFFFFWYLLSLFLSANNTRP